jgi:hypothetical protein
MPSLNKPHTTQLLSCLASRNEIELIVFEKGLGFANAIEGTNLKKVERVVGVIPTITAICYLLTRFNASFNVGRSLTDEQSAMLASDIVEKYPYETIEDIVLMLKLVRQGTIGDGKDYKVDGQNVLAKWMPEYLDRKYEEVERIKQREKSQLNEMADNEHAVTKYYAKIRAEKARKEKDAQMRLEIDAMAKKMTRPMLEETISEWSSRPEMSPYLDYLKQQRRIVK